MRVCAISDLHGRLPEIPPCDVLLICGDVGPDIPYRQTCGSPELAAEYQSQWWNSDYRKWETTVPANEILTTLGNHDWINALPDGLRTKLFIDQAYETRCGASGPIKKFYFTPWVSPCGAWNFCANRAMRKERFALIPEGLDVLVSHSPAYGCGDLPYGMVLTMDGKFEREPAGCIELRAAIYDKKPRYVVFGHIHEGQRNGCYRTTIGNTQLFNCAMWGDWRPTTFEI